MATLFPDNVFKKAEEDIAILKAKDTPAHLTRRVIIILRKGRRNVKTVASQTSLLGRILDIMAVKEMEGQVGNFSSQPAKGQSSYKWQLLCKCSSVYTVPAREQSDCKTCLLQRDNNTEPNFKCILSCCKSCTYCKMITTKERLKSKYCSTSEIKICERCFLYWSLEFCPQCYKCPNCCSRSNCRGKTAPVLGILWCPRGWSKGHKNPQRRLHSPLPDLAKSDKVTNHQKLLCKFHRNCYLTEALHSLMKKKGSRTGWKSEISGGFQPTIFGTKAQQSVETYPRPQQSKPFPQGREIQNGDTKKNKDLPPDSGVGNVQRFQGHLLPHTNTSPVQELPRFSRPGSVLPIQSTTIWPVHFHLLETGRYLFSNAGVKPTSITKYYTNIFMCECHACVQRWMKQKLQNMSRTSKSNYEDKPKDCWITLYLNFLCFGFY